MTWELDYPEYSPDNFYTRATDGKGHSELVHVKLPPHVASALAAIVQSRAVPEYRTTQDLIRDAVVHRLHYLRSSGAAEGIDSIVRFEESARKTLWHQERMKALEEIVTQAASTARELATSGPQGKEEARKMIQDLYAQILEIKDSPFWRDRYLSELKSRLGPLMGELVEE